MATKVEADYSGASWTVFARDTTIALALPETTNTEVVAKTTALMSALS